MKVWPPITMATQHPDNASAPWWSDEPFISTADEINELTTLFQDFAMDEYMWDWEGKYVDEAVGEKLLASAQEYFLEHPLGSEKHLTFRIPAYEGHKMHRMARAFMNILSLADLASECDLDHPMVSEMFLPMVDSCEQPIAVWKTFRDFTENHCSIFHRSSESMSAIGHRCCVTPLVEDVDSMLQIEDILDPYWSLLQESDAIDTERGLRLFLARSDPAMNAGLVPAVLGIKVALSTAESLSQKYQCAVHPILGTGSLPFRGSVNPKYTAKFIEQYAGARTYSIQSAFRYDYPIEEVHRALDEIQKEVPNKSVIDVSPDDHKKIQELCGVFSSIWKPSIESLADLINDVAQYIPKRRERMLHIGLFGYSRGVGKVKLPRAIGFTCALYSVGVPPELIATGRGLREAQKSSSLDIIEKFYPALRADLQHAGKYFNRDNLSTLALKHSVFADIQEDVQAIEEILGIELGPEKPRHDIHKNLTSTIYHRLSNDDLRDSEALTEEIVKAGVIRRSLG